MINNVVLVGRLTRDPELKVTGSNIPFVNFTIAVNRSFTDQSGERQADFISCIVWRQQAENLARYMKQGSQIGVEGRIQTRTYESEQGTRYITEVVANSITFLESRSSQSQGYEPKEQFVQQAPQQRTEEVRDDYYAAADKIVAEDDLPF